jgi:hypothetical protein
MRKTNIEMFDQSDKIFKALQREKAERAEDNR